MKVFKKVISLMLVATLSVSPVSSSFIKNNNTVKANGNLLAYSDDKIVDGEIIKDSELLFALKKIIKGGNNFTFGELKSYSGNINLSSYPNINDVSGLGYAINAKSINISNTKVRYIVAGEFKKCKFSTFVLPDTVEEIEDSAFEQCSNLKTINLPEGLLKIKQTAFALCSSLDGITLPNSLVKIGNSAFQSCESLTSIVIPDNLDALSENADEDKDNGIGSDVFKGCSSLSSVTLGRAMRTIPAGCFANTTMLKSIVIPKGITDIRETAFSDSGLLSIDLSKNQNITVIKKAVFDGCNYLSDIKLPSGITSLGTAAFRSGAYLNTDFLKNLNKLETIGDSCFETSKVEKAYIPPNVTYVGDSCFNSCLYLKELEIADFNEGLDTKKEKRIGKSCFSTTALEKVDFPMDNEDNINISFMIDQYAFEKCNRLGSLVFPKNLKLLGDCAFQSCSKVDKYKTNLYNSRIDSWDVLKDEKFPGSKAYYIYSLSNEDYYFGKLVYADPSSFNTTGDISVYSYSELPNSSITEKEFSGLVGIDFVDLSRCTELSMGKSVFENCFNLEKAYLPDCLEEIPEKTFKNCVSSKLGVGGTTLAINPDTDPNIQPYGGLEEVRFGSNVTKIGKEAFYCCRNLKLDDIPQTLEYICDNAFRACCSLKKITLPQSLKYIGESAFDSCTISTDTKYLLPKSGLEVIDAENASSLQYIGKRAFKNSNIQRFELNSNAPLTILFDETFLGCEYLRIATFSENLQYIGEDVFGNNFRMSTLKIRD
ncbi:MAG: leucine-rich repeat domain-containing protein, partial [Pseudobutyrivibrio sp.]|nr:leucine-rich repeat domain-containing protein [Pseudobutyrivibrio sp.]